MREVIETNQDVAVLRFVAQSCLQNRVAKELWPCRKTPQLGPLEAI
jgi:hypothetical protein